MIPDFYPHIFIESAWHANILSLSLQAISFIMSFFYKDPSAIPWLPEATFFAMKSFGGYPMGIPCALAVSGSVFGQMLNWVIGKALLGHKAKLHVSDYWYNRIAAMFNKYGIFLLLFSWAPVLNLLVVVAGFTNTRLRIVLPLVILGEVYYYGSTLL